MPGPPGSEHDDWYVWADERPAVARSDGSRVWHPDGERFYYGYFWEGMPDLNLENPEVTAELGSIGEFWLEEMGVAGFRIDAARHLIEDGRAAREHRRDLRLAGRLPEPAEGSQARGARPGRGLGRVLDVGPLRPGRRARSDLRLRARERHDHLAAVGRRRLAPRRRSKRSRSSTRPAASRRS